ncbi:acetolactate synthase small subunit [Streptomyces alanosinicus]|uniref:Acetolactate synthase small subunit n=1 Tax=Streptomyces alanosinicus TaxID=68171 RepID=A0A918YTI8_9ACTN|nr:acetolactate synthase small subunit [Streptomyces alanosinicus]GHE16144.1 acetolactate synthase small subunit [Streptomyces alanosinicus]
MTTDTTPRPPRHTLSVLVENKPGVLARVTALFARRGFNIDSIAEGATEHPELSRLTLVVHAEPSALEQVCKQIGKLVQVLKVVELDADSAIHRELMLVKVLSQGTDDRSQILDIAELFRAKTVDISAQVITLEATGSADKLQALLRMLEPFGVHELVRSGTIAIGRGPASTSGRLAQRLHNAA